VKGFPIKQKPFDQNAGHWTAAGHFSARGNFGFFQQQLPLIIVKFSIENRSLSVRGETDEKQLLVS